MPPEDVTLLRTIDHLNQRGGRMLSLVDLLEAGSLSLEMAAYLLRRVNQGASFLTAARPGGAGKTAVMGALLALTPVGAVLREISGPQDLAAPPEARPVWHVCHEMGAGPHYGYLWGQALPRYFALQGPSSYLASNLHADTREEIQEALSGPPNQVPGPLLAQVDLLLTLRRDSHEGRPRYRVTAILSRTGAGHQAAYRWDAATDTHHRVPTSSHLQDLGREEAFLLRLQQAETRELGAFREQLRRFQER